MLATVKGDVHDIGKNIVGVVLGCNNYEVIDLGVMVPAAAILDTAVAEGADAVGLSGLITPSLDEMVNVATEMQRRGLKLPLLIGGATTSRQHTAVRVAPAYDGTTVHVLDASRVVGVVSDLLSDDRAQVLDAANRAEQERLREQHEKSQQRPLLTLEQARANREQVPFDDLPVPAFTGVRTVQPDLATLRGMIDWQFFFLAWELKGKYPAILGQPAARELFDDANTLLDQIIADGPPLCPRRLWLLARALRRRRHPDRPQPPAASALPMLRQQTAKPAGRPNRCLADYVAPAGDHLGGFAVAIHGAEELAASYQADRDDYQSIMVKALADRLAEAFAEHIHLQARRDWYEPDANPAVEDLHAERFRGIRPAFGYPANPDHSAETNPVRPARRRTTRLGPHRIVRDDPGRQRQRAALRPPLVAVLHGRTHRQGPGRGLRPQARRQPHRGRTLAAPQPRLRPRVMPKWGRCLVPAASGPVGTTGSRVVMRPGWSATGPGRAWSGRALQAEVIHACLEGAGRVGRQAGEPDEHVTPVRRRGEPQAHHATRVGRVRDGWQVCQCGCGADAQLEVGAMSRAEPYPDGCDGRRAAHVHEQARARIQVPEVGAGVPVGMPCRGGIPIDRQLCEVAVVALASAGGTERGGACRGERAPRDGARSGRLRRATAPA